MPAVKKATADKKSVCGNVIVSDKIKDHSNDRFFVKKVEEAYAFFQENGFKGLPASTTL